MMDDWHQKLARNLVARTSSGAQAHEEASAREESSTALEVAFGRARAATAYVLELARAHRLPVSGGIVGDDIWVQIADDRARFTLNRREAYIAIRTDGEERRLRWDGARRAIVDTLGALADVEHIAQAAIAAIVDRWNRSPAAARLAKLPPQPDLEREDEPTKG